jgi:hypothetical protein
MQDVAFKKTVDISVAKVINFSVFIEALGVNFGSRFLLAEKKSRTAKKE